MSTVFSEILTRIVYEARYTVSELAGVAGCSASYLYKVMNEDKDISFDKAQRISRYISYHGDNRIAALLVTSEFEVVRRAAGTANGQVDDEITNLAVAQGRAVEGFRLGDAHAMAVAIEDIELQTNNLKAERDRLS